MTGRRLSVRRARRQRSVRMEGFIVTWDVDSASRRQCTRLRFFVFGKTVSSQGRVYRYPGYVELEGVRYLGQSVLFVRESRLASLREFLLHEGIPHVVSEAWLGFILR